MAWIGVILGLAVGMEICLSGALDRHGIPGDLIATWPGTVIFTIASCTLGGLVGNIAAEHWSGRRRRPCA